MNKLPSKNAKFKPTAFKPSLVGKKYICLNDEIFSSMNIEDKLLFEQEIDIADNFRKSANKFWSYQNIKSFPNYAIFENQSLIKLIQQLESNINIFEKISSKERWRCNIFLNKLGASDNFTKPINPPKLPTVKKIIQKEVPLSVSSVSAPQRTRDDILREKLSGPSNDIPSLTVARTVTNNSFADIGNALPTKLELKAQPNSSFSFETDIEDVRVGDKLFKAQIVKNSPDSLNIELKKEVPLRKEILNVTENPIRSLGGFQAPKPRFSKEPISLKINGEDRDADLIVSTDRTILSIQPNLPQVQNFEPPEQLKQLFNTNIFFPDFFYDSESLFDFFDIQNRSLLSNPAFHKIEQIYTFYIEQYEKNIQNISERLLPSLQIFVSELSKKNLDFENTFFQQFLTLDGSIKNVFKDILNKNQEKVSEEDFGEYFDLYSSKIRQFSKEEKSFQYSEKTRNIVVSSSNYLDISKNNFRKVLFPMRAQISFSCSKNKAIANYLHSSNLGNVLIENVINDKIPKSSLNLSLFEAEFNEKTNKFSGIKNSSNSIVAIYDFDLWMENFSLISANPDVSNILFLGNIDDSIDVVNNPSLALQRNFSIFLFQQFFKDISSTYFRTFENIIDKNPAHNDTILYQIDKLDALTGEIIQSFFILNSDYDNNNIIEYIDTQVHYNKEYKYNIYSFDVVLGNEYKYQNIEPTALGANFEVENFSKSILVKKLIAQKNIKIVDAPPIFPDIAFATFSGVTNQIKINLNNNFGELILDPVPIFEEDEGSFNQIKQNQFDLKYSSKIRFKGDDRIDRFQIFRSNVAPSYISDFEQFLIKEVETDVDLVSIQKANAAAYIDNILPNTKYYYLFRSIDVHGHISNPTDVFEVEIIDNNGIVFPIINKFNFSNDQFKDLIKQFHQRIQIKPSLPNLIVNEEKTGLIKNGERVESALPFDQKIVLGRQEGGIWNKNFKLKITSKNSGKEIDFNFRFVYNNKKLT